MASIHKRNNRWQVQVRSCTYGSISKSFHRKSDAQKWAIAQEALMQSSQWSRNMDRGSRVADLLNKYLSDVTPNKRHPEPEKRRLSRLLKDQIAIHYFETFDSTVAAQFRDRRLADGARTTEYDLILLKHAWNIANKEWDWALGPNPMEQIRFTKTNPARERRLMPGDFERLREAASEMSYWYLWPVVELVIETAMRKGELLSLRRCNIDFEKSVALLPQTKSRCPRWVPFT